ncbi:MAG: OB-fold nucleic acid binding domain-containing protein, partial [Rhodospirillaceae bacterium]|nr:OB-fold nucleic acid binding domain-containing protein [Rhodospirillaceae bacterium]
MHTYRTHNCGELRAEQAGSDARLSGWIDRKRDHGNLLFIDLRDNFGTTQVVVDVSSPLFPEIEALPLESVITVTGPVVRRSDETINPGIPTGEVELQIQTFDVQSTADPLPMPVNQDAGYPYVFLFFVVFLDLLREQMH